MTDAACRLPAGLEQDIETYAGEVERFLAGRIAPAVFKAHRVPRGIYEQRRDGTYMLRVRIPGGALAAPQAAALATLSRRYGNGALHLTTRQDIQFHDLAIADTPAIMRRLLEVGLTSRGGGGNTVRNVTACPYAGICPAERLDVTPVAQAVTEYLIGLTGSYNLPRKYKIAFSGCRADCALARVSDLGFIAEVRDSRPGFALWAGGGMGAHSRLADPLANWIPATDAIRAAEAVRRLFDRLGDRTNKHRARLRFVFDKIGADAFRRRFEAELADVTREGVPTCDRQPEIASAPTAAPAGPPAAQAQSGLRCLGQRQSGHLAVPLPIPYGMLEANDLSRLADLAVRYSAERALRVTRTQGLLLRFVRPVDLPSLTRDLRELAAPCLTPSALERFVACPGAATCRLGLCLSRNAAGACADALTARGIDPAALEGMDIHLNGCPNACGQQPIAPVGLYGAAQRHEGRLVPSYRITLGGRVDGARARLGQPAGQVPARALPAFVADLAADFLAGRLPEERFADFYERRGPAPFEALAARHAAIPAYAGRPEFYRDFGSDEEFSLAGRGAGECGAGVFEVIQADIQAAKKAAEPFDKLLLAARALLITRGVDSQDHEEIFRAFERHFLDTALVAEDFRGLLARARGRLQGWANALDSQDAAIAGLLARVELLYGTLDANLAYHPPEAAAAPDSTAPPPASQSPAAAPAPAPTLDLSGVACPMNFVKTKLKLETMEPGAPLEVILDDGEPIRNVPASLRGEGHTVADMTQRPDGRWRLTVRKGTA